MGTPVTAVLDRRETAAGEIVLRRAGADLEIIAAGVFLMSTASGGASERLLVAATLEAARGRGRVLVGGLGMGYSLREAFAHGAERVTVVEIEPAVVDWHRTHLRQVSAGALDDPRVQLVRADLADVLAGAPGRFDAICLDVDNGPDWTVTPANAWLYTDPGLAAVERALAPRGAVGVWSAHAAPAFAERLRARFGAVTEHAVEVPRGEPDRIYVARGGVRRGA